MTQQLLDLVWLDAREAVTVSELAQVCDLSPAELEELVDYGALVPVQEARQERCFSAECVMPLRTVGRLRQDFDLDLFTMAMLLGYLIQIDALELQLTSLRAQLPRQSHTAHS